MVGYVGTGSFSDGEGGVIEFEGITWSDVVLSKYLIDEHHVREMGVGRLTIINLQPLHERLWDSRSSSRCYN